MRTVCKCLPGVLVLISACSAPGALVVTSYRTVAQTNGYAPTSQAQYFAEQRLENITPAVAEVFGDWTGPNADGTPDTWHFVGTSRATSATTITPDSYTVEAAASFSYVVDTTSDFIDPRSTSIFGPAGTGQYRGFFQADVSASYTLAARLNQRGRTFLISSQGMIVFDESNPNSDPRFLNITGTIQPGQYQFFAGTGLASGILPNGINHYERSGSLENLVFNVLVPEPSVHGIAVAILTGVAMKRRPRRALSA